MGAMNRPIVLEASEIGALHFACSNKNCNYRFVSTERIIANHCPVCGSPVELEVVNGLRLGEYLRMHVLDEQVIAYILERMSWDTVDLSEAIDRVMNAHKEERKA